MTKFVRVQFYLKFSLGRLKEVWGQINVFNFPDECLALMEDSGALH